jgi:hypothetical protein
VKKIIYKYSSIFFIILLMLKVLGCGVYAYCGGRSGLKKVEFFSYSYYFTLVSDLLFILIIFFVFLYLVLSSKNEK